MCVVLWVSFVSFPAEFLSIMCFKCPGMFRASCNQRDQCAAPIRARLGRWDGENSILPHHIKHSSTYTLARATYGPQGRRFLWMHLLPASTGAHINACNSSNLRKTLVFGACAVSEMESRRAHMQMPRRADVIQHPRALSRCCRFHTPVQLYQRYRMQ